jgi:hypothetical protein
MSVDFYGCSCCGESKYEEYVGWCTKCGASLCTSCVVNDDIQSSYASQYGVRFDGSKEMMDKYDITQDEIDEGSFEVGELIDDTSIDPKYCPYCQGDEINESQFLSFLIKRSGKSKEELEEEYRKSI